MPDSATKFGDRIANKYSKKPIVDEAAYKKKLEVTRQYFRPDMAVLEFGCGTGSSALLHASYVRHIRATDFSSKMIEIATRKAEEQGVDNVTFEATAIEDLDIPDESIDAVLGMSILHLLENKEEAIARIFRMLKPGGVFVSSTACIADMMFLLKYIVPVGKFLRLFPLVQVFSIRELEQSLTDAGFVIDHQWQPGKGKAVFIVAIRED